MRFWTGIALTLFGLGLIVTFLRKRKKSNNQKSSTNKSTLKTVSPKTIRKDYNSTSKDIITPTEVKEPTAIYESPVKEKPIPKPEIKVTRPKPKPKQDLPQAKAETEKSKNEILKVNYTSFKSEQTDFYPIFRYPKKNTVVRSLSCWNYKTKGI